MAAPSVFRESERSADHVAGFRPLLAGDRGRRDEELEAYRRDMEPEGFALTLTRDMNDLTQACNLIVTATRAVEPVIEGGVRRGTHITAVGADAPGKQELATQIVAEAGDEHRVIAFANPLRSLAGDAAHLTELIKTINGPSCSPVNPTEAR
jgi:ornithine cyclodeaminase/alanine dehydrogenase-like protein (mu-crystallin family)